MARKSRRNKEASDVVIRDEEKKILFGGYVRLSTESDGETIQTQKELIIDYISRSEGMELYKFYIDDGASGTNFARIAFKNMIDDIREGKIKGVIVKDVSRFGRDFLDVGDYIFRIFPFLNIRFVSITDNYNSANSNCSKEELLMAFKNLRDDIYAKDISKKVSSTLHIKRIEGIHTGGYAPYGYVYGKDRALEVDKENAEVVKHIFHLAKLKYSFIKIAEMLNEQEIPSPANYYYKKGVFHKERFGSNMYWMASTVKLICTNPVYLGHMVQHKTISSLPYHIKITKLPPEKWVEVKNTHEAIIDPTTFYAVQDIVNQRKEYYSNHCKPKDEVIRTENKLKGLIFCGDCGRPMKRIHNKHNNELFYRYVCSTYVSMSKTACTKKTIPELLLMDAIHEAILKQIFLAVRLQDFYQFLKQNKKVKQKDLLFEQDIKKTQVVLSKCQMEKRTLYEDYIKGVLNLEEYHIKRNQLQENIASMESEINEYKQKQELYHKNVFQENCWFERVISFKDRKQLDGEIIRSLIKKIQIFDNYHLIITFYFEDELNSLLQELINQEEVNL